MRSDRLNVTYTYPQKCSGCDSGCGASTSVFTDHPISMTQDGERYYYLYNGLGSVAEVIDSNESVVNRYRYTPFGQSMVKNESVYNPYQYTGRRYDEERGNYYYRARIYDQRQSRFLSSDPAEQRANLYAYVGNNPTNRRDPSGGVFVGGPGSPPPRLIDGSAGSAACPQNLEYNSIEECKNSMQYWDDPNRQEECEEEFYGEHDGGGGSWDLPDWDLPDWGDLPLGAGLREDLSPKAQCIIENLGISIAQNPLAYSICAGALAACIGSGTVTGGSSLVVCLSSKAAIGACTKAGIEIAQAAAPCL